MTGKLALTHQLSSAIGRHAPGARGAQRARPPRQLPQRDVRSVDVALLDLPARGPAEDPPRHRDVDLRAQRRHLELDGDLHELLCGAHAAARAAVGDERDRLVVPLRVEVVERVLERRRIAVVVLRRDEHVAVERADRRRPAQRRLRAVLAARRHDRVPVPRQVPLEQIDQLAADVVALARDRLEPRCDPAAAPPVARAGDDDPDQRGVHPADATRLATLRSIRRVRRIAVALVACCALPVPPAAAHAEPAPLADRLAERWVALQRDNGTFLDAIRPDTHDWGRYGETGVGYGLMLAGVRTGRPEWVEAGARAQAYAAAKAADRLSVFESMLIASGYNLLRSRAPATPAFAQQRTVWEDYLRTIGPVY